MDTTTPPVPPVPPTPPAPNDNNVSQWQVALHLCPLVGFVVPFGNLIAPLILWLIKRQESSVIDQTGKDVLNFQISMSIYAIVSAILFFVLIGFVLIFAVFILWIYGMIMAAVKVSNATPYKYPLTITFLR